AFVGFTERAPLGDPNDPDGLAPRLVTSWTQFESLFGGFVEGAVLPLSVFGFFQNGGTLAYIVRIPNSTPAGEPARLALPAADRSLGSPLEITSVEPDADVSVVIETVDGDPDAEGPSAFTLSVVVGGETVEQYPDLTFGGPRDAAAVINKTSTQIKVELKLETDVDLESQLELLRPGLYSLEKAAPVPAPVTGRKFAGSETARSGINGLAIAEDVTMVIVPDLITAATKADGSVDLGLWKAVQTSLI
ncbi:MAG: phage tail sheath family protein, partial [Cellulomonas sp.]